MCVPAQVLHYILYLLVGSWDSLRTGVSVNAQLLKTAAACSVSILRVIKQAVSLAFIPVLLPFFITVVMCLYIILSLADLAGKLVSALPGWKVPCIFG